MTTTREIDRLLSLADTGQPVRACGTCRHVWKAKSMFAKCTATGFYCTTERNFLTNPCGIDGKMWEPRPERAPGAIDKLLRWLFGFRPD